jgi:hypothetical protein
MLETHVQESEEYDSRLLDDGPFMRSARSPSLPRHGYPQSTETYESPFLTDREGEGAQQAEAA